jgi:hypothetical protein
MDNFIKDLMDRVSRLETLVQELQGRVDVYDQRAQSQQANRNASSALLREMNKEDAMRVLNGDLAETSHKEAAEILGLSYQQIYSCRFGYTFKPIHRELERGGWKNVKWVRK